MMGSRLFTALVACTVLAACATTSQRAGARANSNLITEEEIAQSSAPSAYELIQRLRPNFLQTRGTVHGVPSNGTNDLEPVDLVVYLNETRLGGSDQLRQIAPTDIREIRYYTASEATTKWGSGNSAGAIQIIMR
jgi:outer membrane cobalamin receptor